MVILSIFQPSSTLYGLNGSLYQTDNNLIGIPSKKNKRVPKLEINIGPTIFLPSLDWSKINNIKTFGVSLNTNLYSFDKGTKIFGEVSNLFSSYSSNILNTNTSVTNNQYYLPISVGIRQFNSNKLYFGLGVVYGFQDNNYTYSSISTNSSYTPPGNKSTIHYEGFGYNFHLGLKYSKFSFEIKHQNNILRTSNNNNNNTSSLYINNLAVSIFYKILKN
jgi:hypothetical protein